MTNLDWDLIFQDVCHPICAAAHSLQSPLLGVRGAGFCGGQSLFYIFASSTCMDDDVKASSSRECDGTAEANIAGENVGMFKI